MKLRTARREFPIGSVVRLRVRSSTPDMIVTGYVDAECSTEDSLSFGLDDEDQEEEVVVLCSWLMTSGEHQQAHWPATSLVLVGNAVVVSEVEEDGDEEEEDSDEEEEDSDDDAA